MSRRELRWCLAYGLALAAATSVPYLIGSSADSSEWSFTGFLFGVEDGNSYIAKMLRGQRGDWLFYSPYSTAEQRGTLAFLPYLVLGKLSDGSHSQLVLLFHLFRVGSIPLLIAATYRFAAVFLSSVSQRRWVTVLGSIGGGLGWTIVLFGASEWFGSLPLDFYSPETFGFLAIYGLPHLILARAAFFVFASRYLTQTHGWQAGLMLLVAGVIHSPILLPAVAVVAAHQISILGFRSKRSAWLRRSVKALLPAALLLAFLGWSLLTDPYLQAWASQNVIRSPHPVHYLLAFGAVLPAAAVGARRLLRASSDTGLFIIGWMIISPALAYAPIDLQRRLTEGVWVTLLVLAALGIESISAPSRRRIRVALTSALLPSSALLLVFGIQTARDPQRPAFRAASEVRVFDALATEAAEGSVALAAFDTSNAMPAWAPVTVVAGHGPESADLAMLLPQVAAFFDEHTSEEQRKGIIAAHSVDYVILGPAERELGDYDPTESECFEPVHRTGGFELFVVCES